MISGIFGLPGAGKSTFLAWCVDRVRRRRSLSVGFSLAGGVSLQDLCSRDYDRIYSNFPMLGCYPLDWDRLGVYEYSNCLILIDEIMMLCDSRAWKTYPENIKYFMSHHRKYAVDTKRPHKANNPQPKAAPKSPSEQWKRTQCHKRIDKKRDKEAHYFLYPLVPLYAEKSAPSRLVNI